MTDRSDYILGPGPKREKPKLRPPDKHCAQCGGTGWIESVEERLPVMRCGCMTQEDDDT